MHIKIEKRPYVNIEPLRNYKIILGKKNINKLLWYIYCISAYCERKYKIRLVIFS